LRVRNTEGNLSLYLYRGHFLEALRAGAAEADERTERSLYERANGYTFDSEKVFMTKEGEIVRAPIKGHVPPDVHAAEFWLKNRRPDRWRDVQQLEHVLGKFIISDRPMTAEEWIAERATVVEETKQIEDKR
jgi:hypothetical protein